MSTAVTAEARTRKAVEGMRHDVQLQIDQTREDARHQDEENKLRTVNVSASLERLTQPLNAFKSTSEMEVGD